MKIYYQTTKCIQCLKRATNWGGHVLNEKECIIAGWCDKHVGMFSPNLMGKTGCFGGWHKKYGREEPDMDTDDTIRIG